MTGIFDKKTPGKKIKAILEQLGPGYYLTIRDFENVICRKINDCYEIEISGLDDAKKTINAWVYVHYIGHENKFPDVEREDGLHNMAAVRNSIYRFVEKYQDLT